MSSAESDDAFLLNLGRGLLARRAEADISQAQLASKAGMSTRFLFDVEKGRQNISILMLRRIALALKTPLEELVAREARAPILQKELRPDFLNVADR